MSLICALKVCRVDTTTVLRELRAVNHWFQNKRQAVKRRGKIQSAKEEREEMQEKQERPEKPEKPAPVSQQRPLRAEATWPVAQSQQAGSSKVTTTKPLRQRVSLNNFLNTSNRPVERRTSLWDYMLSSPPQPQPSSHEPPSRGRLSPSLPRHPPKKKQRSLEWACAHSQLVESDVEADLVDTDVEDDGRSEAATDVNTPGTSEGRRSATNLSPITSVSDVGTAAKDDRQLPAEEMEAAMVLLDFMRR